MVVNTAKPESTPRPWKRGDLKRMLPEAQWLFAFVSRGARTAEKAETSSMSSCKGKAEQMLLKEARDISSESEPPKRYYLDLLSNLPTCCFLTEHLLESPD